MERRIIELALEALLSKKSVVDKEIEVIRAELARLGVKEGARGKVAAGAGRPKRRKMSAAARKAVGERMRAYWAKRRSAKAPTKGTK